MDAKEAAQSQKKWRRASIACVRCHRRKVRCNAATQGRPCTNCRLDGLECVVSPQNAKRSSPRNRRRHLAAIINSSTLQDACQSEMEQITLTSYNNFPCLGVSSTQRVRPADMAFLQSQRCFSIPEKPFLDILVANYFQHVHPFLPIINEALFWTLYRRGSPGDSVLSLLVFQAMLFAACSYVPSTIAKNNGVNSMTVLRNSLYRRGKLLYDFGAEDDPISLAQAALLLTYQSTDDDCSSNSTWLSVAIQHARTAHCRASDSYPTGAPYKRNDLKRLWWALVIRDRLIALGMRRPLQILPNSFDVAVHQPLSVDDFTDEINASEVYEAETKTVLCKILTSLCLLTAPLTKIIQISYPSHSRPQRRRADASALEVVQHHLYDWEHSQAVKLRKEHEKKPNNSTDFYNKLTTLYYETARLTLYHHMSSCLYEDQSQKNRLRLAQTIKNINDMVKTFVADGTVEYLPISVVACTAIPQIASNLNLQLTARPDHRNGGKNILEAYRKLNHQSKLRFGVSQVSSWIDKSLRLLNVSAPPNNINLGMSLEYTRFPQDIGLQSALYFQLADIIDCSLAAGCSTIEQHSSEFASCARIDGNIESARHLERTLKAIAHPLSSNLEVDERTSQTRELQVVLSLGIYSPTDNTYSIGDEIEEPKETSMVSYTEDAPELQARFAEFEQSPNLWPIWAYDVCENSGLFGA